MKNIFFSLGLLALMGLSGKVQADVVWYCGYPVSSDVVATLRDSTLTIRGSGDMVNYGSSSPWQSYRTSIATVVIGDSIISIGNFAFGSCSSLTSVTIGNSVTSIGDNAFHSCYSLKSVTIPNSVTNIGNYVFSFCNSLTSVTIPDGVTSIGNEAFYYCYGLTTVTIPNGVTTIGDFAFDLCYNLTSITSKAIIPPVLGFNVFRDVPANIPVYIPCGTYNDYSTASEWNYFSNFIEMPTDTGFYVATFPQGAIYSDSNFTDLTETGRYCITLQNENGCDSVVCLDLTYDYTGIVETLLATSLRVYPNPTMGMLTINDECLMINKVEVYNVTGQVVFTSAVSPRPPK